MRSHRCCGGAPRLLAGASFLAAVDLHAAAPRVTSAVVLLLYALVVLTCVLQLPTDVALAVGRQSRLGALDAHLNAHLGVNGTAAIVTPTPYRPDLLPEAQLESGGGFFSTALSADQLGFFHALIAVRAFLATVAWLLCCLLQSGPAFAVPPLPEDEFEDVGGLERW